MYRHRSSILGLGVVGGCLQLALSVVPFIYNTTEEISAAPTIDAIVQGVLAERTAAVLQDPDTSFGDNNVINVLVLGIDSRKEGTEQHCDAIHMFSINVQTWDVVITSTPRGTTATLPPGQAHLPSDYYLANACGFGGLDYGIAQIEAVMGIQHDYLVTVGFSQALGVFRALQLPTTETLQWLRHRQGYAIGDPQRSHNQAVFMGDMLRRFSSSDQQIPIALQYVLYKFIDTDMEFGTARALYEGFIASGRASEDAAITRDMKPFYATVDYHFDLENPEEQIAQLLERIRPYLSKQDLSDRTLTEVQAELITYLVDALQQPEEAQHIVDDELWSQVEDVDVREGMHYAYVEWYIQSQVVSGQSSAATEYLADYILEKQTLGISEYEAKGRQLMEEIVQ